MKTTKKIYDFQSLSFMRHTDLKVGILGGSFNPAHQGHISISQQAINKYGFDYIIWLVANQNPLKPLYKIDIFTRCSQALACVENPKILVSSVEHDLNTYYVYDSLKGLINRFNSVNFTWLMGIDNIENFHRWYRYQDITNLCPIIIFDRPVSTRMVNNSNFFFKFNPIVDKTQSINIIIYRSTLDSTSSTNIRKKE